MSENDALVWPNSRRETSPLKAKWPGCRFVFSKSGVPGLCPIGQTGRCQVASLQQRNHVLPCGLGCG